MNASILGTDAQAVFLWKLWIYTNYDCNLKCSYCFARSGPNVQRLVGEAVRLGFGDVF